MKTRTRLAALTIAGTALLAAGIATPAQAATVTAAEKPSRTITLEHFPTLGTCEAVEQLTSRLIRTFGGEVFAGSSCADGGDGRGYGFSITYR